MVFPEYEHYDAVGLAQLIDKGDITPREVMAAAVERIELANPELNAVIHKTYERAMARVEAGLPEGPLRGVPFLLKDLSVAYAGAPMTMGSRATRHFVPGYTSTLVDRYEAAGLVILGKTNTPEFGLAPVTEPELHGITRNPWDPTKTAGGSSGGSAAAVAAGMVPAAHASDGGGSIRIPASVNGLFGLKPTRARTPVGPVLGEGWFGLSVNHVVTRTVRDSAVLLDIGQGPEPGDPYAAPPPTRSFLEELGVKPSTLRVAATAEPIMGSSQDEVCRRAVHDAARLLEGLGHRVQYVEVPIDREILTEAFLTLAAAEAALLIAQTGELAGRKRPSPEDYELADWVLGLAGQRLTAEDFAAALFEVRTAGRAMGQFFQEFDVLVTSTLGRAPWAHGELQPTNAERRLLEGLRRAPLRPAVLAVFRQLADKVIEPIPNTPLFNLTGQPAMSVPLHETDGGLPVGVQFAARLGDEATLLRLAGQLEQARPWADRYPFA
jgi:amidase